MSVFHWYHIVSYHIISHNIISDISFVISAQILPTPSRKELELNTHMHLLHTYILVTHPAESVPPVSGATAVGVVFV